MEVRETGMVGSSENVFVEETFEGEVEGEGG